MGNGCRRVVSAYRRRRRVGSCVQRKRNFERWGRHSDGVLLGKPRCCQRRMGPRPGSDTSGGCSRGTCGHPLLSRWGLAGAGDPNLRRAALARVRGRHHLCRLAGSAYSDPGDCGFISDAARAGPGAQHRLSPAAGTSSTGSRDAVPIGYATGVGHPNRSLGVISGVDVAGDGTLTRTTCSA